MSALLRLRRLGYWSSANNVSGGIHRVGPTRVQLSSSN